MLIHSLRVRQEASQTEGEPTREKTGGTTTHWFLLQLVMELEVTEAEKGDEEKGDRRQDLTTDGLGRGFPKWASSIVKSSRNWGAEGKAPVSAGKSPFEDDSCTKWCIRKVELV
jgi:hypothetical protein